jgi:hypothetical protein
MLAMLEDTTLRKNLIALGKARLPLFSSRQLAEGTMNIYKNLV